MTSQLVSLMCDRPNENVYVLAEKDRKRSLDFYELMTVILRNNVFLCVFTDQFDRRHQ